MVGVVAGALVLAGCGGDDEETTTPTEPTTQTSEEPTEDAATETTTEATAEPTEDAAEETTTEETTTEEATEVTEEPTGDAAEETTEGPVEGSAAGAAELSPPGTELAVGEPGTIHVQALEEGDEFYGYAVLETTVTEIEQGDPAVFEQFENAEEFEGLVPYYIRAEHVIQSIEGEPNANMTPVLAGVYENGTPAGVAISFGGFGDVCSSELYPELAEGEVATTCTVALAEEGGREVAGAEWSGDDYADGYGDENAYSDEPVTWMQ